MTERVVCCYCGTVEGVYDSGNDLVATHEGVSWYVRHERCEEFHLAMLQVQRQQAARFERERRIVEAAVKASRQQPLDELLDSLTPEKIEEMIRD